MPKCEKHNEEKRLIGCSNGTLLYRCESCLKEQLKGLAEDVAELRKINGTKDFFETIETSAKRKRDKEFNKKITGNEDGIHPWCCKMDAETDDEYDVGKDW